MNNDFIIVDVNRDGTSVRKINAENGKYRHVLNVQGGTLREQAGVIAVHVLKHRPAKVFIDDIGVDAALRDSLKVELSEMRLQLLNNATVIYS